MSRKLIVGYDGSEQGDDALALGRVLADCLAARPLVAHVRPPLPHLPLSAEVEEIVEREVEEVLAKGRTRFGKREVETLALVASSSPHALHDIAEAEHPIALVLGSPHRGPVGRVLVGSTGSALLSGAPCAIAVAPRGYAEREQRSLQRVCVAIDDSAEARVALAAASGVAARTRASLLVVSVVEPVRYDYPTPYPVLDPVREQEHAEEAVRQTLDEAVARLPADFPAESRLMVGDPASLIAEVAADHDLLVVGSRAYGPVRRAFLGSVSVKLMATAQAPVLVLPREAGEDPLGLDVGGDAAG